MEFGFDQLRTGLRPVSSRFELSRHVEIARTWSQTISNPNSITLSWSQTGLRLVADRAEAGLKPASSCQLAASQAKFQLDAGLRPASNLSATNNGICVMEFALTQFYAKNEKLSATVQLLNFVVKITFRQHAVSDCQALVFNCDQSTYNTCARISGHNILENVSLQLS